MVATVKIIPFAVPASLWSAAARARHGPLVRIAPFRPWRARLIQTELPSLAAKVLDKTVRITRDRLEAARLVNCFGKPAARTSPRRWRELMRRRSRRVRHLLIAGASAIVDRARRGAGRHRSGRRADRAFRHAGRSRQPAAAGAAATASRCWACRAAPGRPSTTASTWCWSGWPPACRSAAPRSCAWAPAACWPRSRPARSRATRGDEASARPRQGRARWCWRPASRRRMGGPNKLLAEAEGKPLVRACRRRRRSPRRRSRSSSCWATGRRGRVEQALRGLKAALRRPTRISPRASAPRCAPASARCRQGGRRGRRLLGDMPRVSAGAARPADRGLQPGRRPLDLRADGGGKRGNPVLWARRFFPRWQSSPATSAPST